MSILVMGAGNTGSFVINGLAELTADYKVMLRDPDKAVTLGLDSSAVVPGDFADPDSLVQATRGIERIYLAMAIHPDNEQWVANVIKACQANNVKHIVKLSGFGADEFAGSHIIRVHAKTDQMIKESGITYTLLQPNSFFQNLYASLPSITHMGKFFLPVGDASLAFIDIRDVAAVAVKTLTDDGHENKTYRLTGPSAMTYHGQAQTLSISADKVIEYVPVPEDAAKAAMMESGMDEWLAGVLAEILTWFATADYSQVTGDVERITGKPARNFSNFADEFKHAL